MKLIYTPDGYPYWIPDEDEQAAPSKEPDVTVRPLPAFQPDKDVPPALQQFDPMQEGPNPPAPTPVGAGPTDISQPLEAPVPDLPPPVQQFQPPASYEEAPDLPPASTPNVMDTLFPPMQRQMVRGATTDAFSGLLEAAGPIVGAAASLSPMAAISPAFKQAAQQIGPASAQAADIIKQGGARVLGVNQKPQGLERLANAAGGAIMPAGKATIPLAAAGTALNYIPDAIDAMFPAAHAAPAPNPNAPPPSPITTPVESAGGPTEMRTPELKTLGVLAAATIGMALGPRMYRAVKAGAVPLMKSYMPSAINDFVFPTARSVGEHAAPGTLAISSPKDLARTYDDANAGIFRVLKKWGVNGTAMQQLENVWAIQTRATANAMAETAINTGRMDTPLYQFVSKTPLAELARIDTKATSDYLHALQTIEQIKQHSLKSLKGRGPVAGPPVIRGMSLADATAVKKALEQSNPEVVPFAKAFADIAQSMRKFEAAGEYATIPQKTSTRSKSSYRFLNANYKYGNPSKVIGEPVTRGPVTQDMAKEMMVRLRKRMENEAVGMYVDISRKAEPRSFVRVTEEQLKKNPNWHQNTVSFYRRGVKETYTADPMVADVLQLDPYMMTGMLSNGAYMAKRWIEVGTTGELAPHFAVTSMLRSWQIAKFTTEEGLRSPSFAGTLSAVPRQLAPQIANRLAEAVTNSLQRGSNGWLSQVFPTAWIQGAAARLADYYAKSLWLQLQHAGGGRGSILQQQTHANNRLANAIKNATGPAKQFLEGYRAVLNSLHNAPAYDFAGKNFGRMPTWQLAKKARDLTGDPRIGGQYKSGGRTIRFENNASRVSHTVGKLTKAYGAVTEIGRTSVPWYNATVQGIKRLGKAYLENPVRFMKNAWLYQGTPAAAFYLWTRSLGKDPNGLDYTDYKMNRRSDYNKTMNYYIPIPGLPAEYGIEFPRFHEMTPLAHMTEIALDHAFRSSLFTEEEDMRHAGANFAKVIVDPALPSWITVPLAMAGMQPPQGLSGLFTGDTYKLREEPFDQLGGMPKVVEAVLRSMFPGIADYVGSGYAAYTQTPKGFIDAIGNMGTAVGKRLIAKTPLVRDVANIHAPISGVNAVSEEMHARRKVLSELERFYKSQTVAKGMIGVRQTSRGLNAPEGKSAEGGALATERLGERPPAQPAGLTQPVPTNPLYSFFIESLHNKFVKDAPHDRKGEETGAMGFPSLMERYNWLSQHIRTLQKVNDGNNVTWQQQLQKPLPNVPGAPTQLDYLRRNSVNPKNLNEVRNFYEKKRQDAARYILFMIRGVEKEMSDALGKPIKLEDIRPYGKGLETKEELFGGDDTEQGGGYQ